ncbi:MAG TPA: thymidine phosphorylase [Candidatus Paceibacterota bacterium]|nr:thymidine phosphorylase [Candidatus Paceibacterota bacterium]
MKLKVKFSNWKAGRPIAILNDKTALRMSANVNDRILITHNSKKTIAVIDISSKMVKDREIILSVEVLSQLNLKNSEIVNVDLAKKPGVVNIINKKLLCKPLSEKEIKNIVSSIVDNALTEIEIAFFISAVYKCGMTLDEVTYLTKSMVETGKRLKLKGKYIVDKHSIGGIAGNRTTPLVVSICASQGLIFPKTSSRAITSAAGTADVMEAVCKVNFSIREIESIIKKTNACLVWGGSLGFAPADDKIIRVENQIHIDPEPNLLASILAKKISAGSKYVLIDIPYGKFAKVNKKEAIELKNKFENLGKKFNLKLKGVITKGDQPIGNGVGPILEIKDIISVLKCEKNAPQDLRKKAVFLSGQIFELCGKTKKGKGETLAIKALESGQAFERFRKIVEAQKGSLDNLSLAKFNKEIKSEKSGKVISIDNKKINFLARVAGSPLDKKAGLFLFKHNSEKVKIGEPLITIYSQSKRRLEDALDFYNKNKIFTIK